MTTTECLITWNVGGAKDVAILDALTDMVAAHPVPQPDDLHAEKPAGFALCEVADRGAVLGEFCRESGYRLVRIDKGQHSTAVAVLIRADLPDQGSGTFRLSPRRFVGRKVAGSRDDGWTKAKWATWARTTFWEMKWTVASTHLTPSHHIKAARRLALVQVTVLAVWARTRRREVALGGDFNEELDARHGTLRALKALLTPYTRPSHGDGRHLRAIDMWWLREKRLARRGISVTVEALAGYPSDHRPVVVTLHRPDAK